MQGTHETKNDTVLITTREMYPEYWETHTYLHKVIATRPRKAKTYKTNDNQFSELHKDIVEYHIQLTDNWMF